jgi:hypothetical protein
VSVNPNWHFVSLALHREGVQEANGAIPARRDMWVKEFGEPFAAGFGVLLFRNQSVSR